MSNDVKVEQVDERAAEKVWQEIGPFRMGALQKLVEAFAHHRARHQPQREAVLEEAAARAREEPYPSNPEGDWTPYAKDMAHAAVRAESAILALKATPAPAESRDDQALLADIFAKMEEVLKPLPGIPDAPGQHAGTRATESGDGDEA